MLSDSGGPHLLKSPSSDSHIVSRMSIYSAIAISLQSSNSSHLSDECTTFCIYIYTVVHGKKFVNIKSKTSCSLGLQHWFIPSLARRTAVVRCFTTSHHKALQSYEIYSNKIIKWLFMKSTESMILLAALLVPSCEAVHHNSQKLDRDVGGVPAQEEGHVEERGEESEELEGEHLDSEASLGGCKRVCLLWHTETSQRDYFMDLFLTMCQWHPRCKVWSSPNSHSLRETHLFTYRKKTDILIWQRLRHHPYLIGAIYALASSRYPTSSHTVRPIASAWLDTAKTYIYCTNLNNLCQIRQTRDINFSLCNK